MREEEKRRAVEASRAVLASIGTDLMNAYNQGRHDPSFMAVRGHDTARGYEFCVERGGRTAVATVGWEWDLELCH